MQNPSNDHEIYHQVVYFPLPCSSTFMWSPGVSPAHYRPGSPARRSEYECLPQTIHGTDILTDQVRAWSRTSETFGVENPPSSALIDRQLLQNLHADAIFPDFGGQLGQHIFQSHGWFGSSILGCGLQFCAGRFDFMLLGWRPKSDTP